MENFRIIILYSIFLLLILSCQQPSETRTLSISNQEGMNNCLSLEKIIKREALDKYLVDKGDYFEVLPPYNKLSKTMNKPVFFDEDMFKLFRLEGLFPVNFLVNKSGVVKAIGNISELFHDGNTEIFTIQNGMN